MTARPPRCDASDSDPCARGAWGADDRCLTHEGFELDSAGLCIVGRHHAASLEREADFLSALAFLDVHYGTESPPEDPHWDDPAERRSHVGHAVSMGWTRPVGEQ